MRLVILSVVAGLVFGPSSAGASIVNGQLDDFQDGTTQGWGSGGANPNPPANIAGGGPAGAGDDYLQVTSTGGGGPGSKLIAFNSAQWAGNYTGNGVTSIELDLKNFGINPLSIRFTFNGPGGAFSTTNAFSLPAGGAGAPWMHAALQITAADLTAVGGTDAAATLANVSELRLLHNDVPSFVGGTIDAQIGVDNIQAVPEPATLSLLALGGMALLRRRR